MPVGVIALLVVAILVYFGLLHRVLDRMRLDDRTALFVLFLMIVGSFFNIRIWGRPVLILNVGGALVPIGIAVYLIATADTRQEKVRGTAAALISGAVIYLAIKFLNPEEQTMIIDPTYFFAIISGVVGYLSGRSRRSAFIGGTMGIVLADFAHFVEISARGIPARTWVGGAGIFDAVVISGLLAVLLAEVVGETREYMVRGQAGEARGRGASEGVVGGAGAGGGGRGEAGARASGRGGTEEAGKPGEASRGDRELGGRGGDGGGNGGSFVAAFGVGGGSERGARTRNAHRAGRGGRGGRGADRRARPATSGGAGWEPPMLGDYVGGEVIGSVGAPPSSLTPGEEGAEGIGRTQTAPKGAAGAGPDSLGEAGLLGSSVYVTEPDNSLAPGTGADLTAVDSPRGERSAGPARNRRNGGRPRGPKGRGDGEGRYGGLKGGDRNA